MQNGFDTPDLMSSKSSSVRDMPKTVTDDTTKSQRERFEEAARELGVDLDEEKLREMLRKIAPEKPAPASDRDQRD